MSTLFRYQNPCPDKTHDEFADRRFADSPVVFQDLSTPEEDGIVIDLLAHEEDYES